MDGTGAGSYMVHWLLITLARTLIIGARTLSDSPSSRHKQSIGEAAQLYLENHHHTTESYQGVLTRSLCFHNNISPRAPPWASIHNMDRCHSHISTLPSDEKCHKYKKSVFWANQYFFIYLPKGINFTQFLQNKKDSEGMISISMWFISFISNFYVTFCRKQFICRLPEE